MLSQNTKRTIKKLRNRETVKHFDRKTKLFHNIKYNRHGTWRRYVSLDRRNWTLWNKYLSLKEVLDLRAQIAINCQEMCFKN